MRTSERTPREDSAGRVIWTLYLDEAGTFGCDPDAVSGGVLFRGPMDQDDDRQLRSGFLSVYVDGFWPPHRAERDLPAAVVALAMWPSRLTYLPWVHRLAEIGATLPSLNRARQEGRFPTRDELLTAGNRLRLSVLGQRDREFVLSGRRATQEARVRLFAQLPCRWRSHWIGAAAAVDATANGLVEAHLACVRRALLFGWEEDVDVLRVVLEEHNQLASAGELSERWTEEAGRLGFRVRVEVQIVAKGETTPAGTVVADHVSAVLRAGPNHSLEDLERRLLKRIGRDAVGTMFDGSDLPSLLRCGPWHAAECDAVMGFEHRPTGPAWLWEREQGERWVDWLLHAP